MRSVSGVREKSRAKSKPAQARRRILYVQTGIDFHRLMCEPCCATQQNQALAKALDVPKADSPVSVLDLAAGSGVWSIALAQHSPQVRVTAVDWPGIIAITQKVTARHGVADRYAFVAGDLHEANFGQEHAIATLGHILHSEGEERSRQLLRKTFDALAPGGTIAIAEI
jgi:ubiquinone/menaquinone biosynthesis C-methylase UbiE